MVGIAIDHNANKVTEAPLNRREPSEVLALLNNFCDGLWGWVESAVSPLVETEPPNFLELRGVPAPVGVGHFVLMGESWASIDASQIPTAIAWDVEPNNIDGFWRPRLAVGYGADRRWYLWQDEADLIPFPQQRIVIGHNFAANDSQFLSCEYEAVQSPCIYLDTMALVTIVAGVPRGGRSTFEKFAKQQAGGKSAPEWFSHVSGNSLEEICSRILGLQFYKGINTSDPNAPHNRIEYCAQDVALSIRIFSRFIAMTRQRYLPSTISWVAMALIPGGCAWYGEKAWSELLENFEYAAEIMPTGDKFKKAWPKLRPYFKQVYRPNGAVKHTLNPAGNVIDRWPTSPVFSNEYSSEGVNPYYFISEESAQLHRASCELVVYGTTLRALKHSTVAPLGGQCPPAIMEYPVSRTKSKLRREWSEGTGLTDLMHILLCESFRLFQEKGLEARLVGVWKEAAEARTKPKGEAAELPEEYRRANYKTIPEAMAEGDIPSFQPEDVRIVLQWMVSDPNTTTEEIQAVCVHASNLVQSFLHALVGAENF